MRAGQRRAKQSQKQAPCHFVDDTAPEIGKQEKESMVRTIHDLIQYSRVMKSIICWK